MFYNIRLPDIYSEAHQMGLLGRMDFLYAFIRLPDISPHNTASAFLHLN